MAAVARELPGQQLGIHCHNDSGCAVANSLAAVRAGATQVQGTVNGFGERVGNTDLLTVVADLELKMGCTCVGEERPVSYTHLDVYKRQEQQHRQSGDLVGHRRHYRRSHCGRLCVVLLLLQKG